ncbi:helix-turn-helix domain-containing protein [Streptomyces sp. NPDC055897]
MKRHTYPEAAEILRVEESWLRRHTPKRFPHSKKGREVTFSDADLDRIDELTHRDPTRGALSLAPNQGSAGARPLANLRPLPRRGSAQRTS